MSNKEKAINIGENNLDRCFGSKRDYGVTCALEMAQWKDSQYEEEKKDLLGLVNMLKIDETNQTIIEDLKAMLQ